MTKHRALLTALAALAMASLSLGRAAPVSASTGPNLTVSCPSSVVQGTTFDCIVGWGAITPGSEPAGYGIAIVYNSPAVSSGTPAGFGTFMTLNSITKEYSAGTMWGSGAETCTPDVINAAAATLPTGWAAAGTACSESGTPSGARLSPHALLRFRFTAMGIGTTLVHLITLTQGGAYGSRTTDIAAVNQTNSYSCGGAVCSATPWNTPDNPTDPIITIVPPYTGAISGHVYHDSVSPANALAGAVVHACPAAGPCESAYTDSTGAYTIRYLANGSYDVSTLDRAPYLAATIGSVSVSGGTTTSGHDVVMVAPPGAISGTVYLNAAGAGNELAGAMIEACPRVSGACRSAVANGAGSYSIPSLIDGEYAMRAWDPSTGVQATIGPVTVAGANTSGHDVVVVVPTGSISGHIYHDSATPGNEVANAAVWACGTGACRWGTTDGSGAYTLGAVADGTYIVSTSPAAGFLPTSVSGVTVAGGGPTPGQDLVVLPPLPLSGSPGTTVNGTSDELPGLRRNDPLTLTKVGCPGGTASYSIAGDDGVMVIGSSIPEGPAGTYEASSIMIPFGTPAPLTITITLDCGSGPVSNSFNAQYIDPSGFVKTVTGAPIAGATVKLFRSDTAAGPFVQVPNNSTIMSPQNRTNPDTTDVDGHFGWDVIAGYYQVRASMAGCVSAADPSEQVVTWRSYAETAVLEIPPPVLDIDLRLDCGDADNDGYANKVEDAIGGNSTIYCKMMRADLDDDGVVTILDLSRAAGVFGQPVPPAPARYDQGEFSRDNSINILDLSAMASVYGKPVTQCL